MSEGSRPEDDTTSAGAGSRNESTANTAGRAGSGPQHDPRASITGATITQSDSAEGTRLLRPHT
ncbi:hypothetical protein DN508_31065, partial [Burkholderia multivorans]